MSTSGDTCNIDAGLIEAAVVHARSADEPVPGGSPNMDRSTRSRRCSLPVIEDGAQTSARATGAQAATCRQQLTELFSQASRSAAAATTTARSSPSDALAQGDARMRSHGQARYTHTRVGVSRHMDTLKCAVIARQLERFA